MTNILFLIVLHASTFTTTQIGTFDAMSECFEAREVLVKSVGRPIKNYQALCIIKE